MACFYDFFLNKFSLILIFHSFCSQWWPWAYLKSILEPRGKSRSWKWKNKKKAEDIKREQTLINNAKVHMVWVLKNTICFLCCSLIMLSIFIGERFVLKVVPFEYVRICKTILITMFIWICKKHEWQQCWMWFCFLLFEYQVYLMNLVLY